MILVDTNLLLLATTPNPLRPAASAWLDERMWSHARVGLPWQVLLSWLRLVTNRRIYENPITIKQGWALIDEWLSQEPVWIPQPTERHAEVYGALLDSANVRDANLLPDVHLAALAIEHGLEVNSTDGDFARFTAVRWKNPLA
ncbi:MAG: TA system VapC family ribonuclease toxin [Archangium sp.]